MTRWMTAVRRYLSRLANSWQTVLTAGWVVCLGYGLALGALITIARFPRPLWTSSWTWVAVVTVVLGATGALADAVVGVVTHRGAAQRLAWRRTRRICRLVRRRARAVH